MEKKSLLSVDEAAEQLGLRPVTIYKWIRDRRIGHVKLGRRALIPSREVDRLIRENLHPAHFANAAPTDPQLRRSGDKE